MRIKISQDQTIEIKTKWIVWGFVTVFIILPLLPPLGSALWTLIDDLICDQNKVCRESRRSSQEMENITKEIKRLAEEADKRHR